MPRSSANHRRKLLLTPLVPELLLGNVHHFVKLQLHAFEPGVQETVSTKPEL